MTEESSETHPEENYEDVSVYDLDADVEEQLLQAHNECTFIWANREGWPVGVIMSYIWRDGRFWLTASSQRARISAVRRDPRVCIVVTSTGSPLPRNKAITWKGTCKVHDDARDQGVVLSGICRSALPRQRSRPSLLCLVLGLAAAGDSRGGADTAHRLRRLEDVQGHSPLARLSERLSHTNR